MPPCLEQAPCVVLALDWVPSLQTILLAWFWVLRAVVWPAGLAAAFSTGLAVVLAGVAAALVTAAGAVLAAGGAALLTAAGTVFCVPVGTGVGAAKVLSDVAPKIASKMAADKFFILLRRIIMRTVCAC